jgi:acyl carrier protein
VNRSQIEDLIINLYAETENKDPIKLRVELERGGGELPIDSLLAVEILVGVQEKCGVELPTSVESAKNLTSVSSFAQAMLDEIHKQSFDKGAST